MKSSAGVFLVGSSAILAYLIIKMSGMNPSWESIAALVVIAAPAVYASYYLWRREKSLIPSLAPGYRENHDPQFVRDRTAQWDSNQSDHRQPTTEASTGGMSPDEVRPEYRRDTQSAQATSSDLTALEFDWTVNSDTEFADVGGMGDVKTELERDVIKPLTTHREKAETLGITPSNIIFHGPPGTGKTYIAKAMATEVGLPFANVSGADIQSKWINESSQKVKEMFEEAESVAAQAGGAVVFLDELDSVLKNRGAGQSHEEDTKVVNEFLNHLEHTDEHDIVFIGATNRLEALDAAGIRSGRIDKKIHIGMPDSETRTAILKAQLADRPHHLSEDHIRTTADRTEGMTAADLTSLVETAARNSLYRSGNGGITQEDMQQALTN